jgi:DNA-binding NtrC family response regulator
VTRDGRLALSNGTVRGDGACAQPHMIVANPHTFEWPLHGCKDALLHEFGGLTVHEFQDRPLCSWNEFRTDDGISLANCCFRDTGRFCVTMVYLSKMTAPSAIDLLVVDDDSEFRETLVSRFVRTGFAVQSAGNGEEALGLAERRNFDVAIFDMMMPVMSGLELLKRFKESHPDCEVILLTGQGSIETAVEAMKLGAYDYLQKPFPLKDLESVASKAFDRRRLRKENTQLRALIERSRPAHDMVGRSPAMQEVFRLIERAGPSDKSILIQGESGTGKELVARALHAHSSRAEKPMVVINCAALPETLLESELFGHERGSFTGAVSAKPGLFEVADGGTLFIDEIGELPGSLQAKLLRVLEDGSLRRI